MDFFLLPEKMKGMLESSGMKPGSVVRSSSSLDGGPGECYVAAADGIIQIFDKRIGDDDYRSLEMRLSKGDTAEIKKESFNLLLELDGSAGSHSMKFSSFDETALRGVVERFNTAGAPSAPPGRKASADAPRQVAQPQSKSPGGETLTPLEWLAAALMYVATADGVIEESEDAYIKRVCRGHEAELQRAFKFYKAHEYTDMPGAMPRGLRQEQALCIVANICELCMSDGVFRSNEQGMLRYFSDSLGLGSDEYDTVKDVLLLKNRLGELYGREA